MILATIGSSNLVPGNVGVESKTESKLERKLIYILVGPKVH